MKYFISVIAACEILTPENISIPNKFLLSNTSSKQLLFNYKFHVIRVPSYRYKHYLVNKMKTHIHYFLVLVFTFFCVSILNAQLRNRYATLQNNFQNINPAAINHLNVSRIVGGRLAMISAQHQQQDIDGSNSISSQNVRFEFIDPDARVLFGGGITQEEVHIHKTTQIAGNFSYQIDLDRRGSSAENQRYLSLGGGGAVNFQSTDLDLLRYADDTDLVRPISSFQYYTVSGGAFYLAKDKKQPTFYAGVSAYHNVGSTNTPASTQFFAIAGMIFSTKNKALLLEPNTTIRYATYDGFIVNSIIASPLSVDAGLRLWYDAQGTFGFFGGANVGTNERARIEAGFSILTKKSGPKRQKLPTRGQRKRNKTSTNALRIGYTYDFKYKGDFKTASISEIFASVPISLPKRR